MLFYIFFFMILGAIKGVFNKIDPDTPQKNAFKEVSEDCDKPTHQKYYQALNAADNAYEEKKTTMEILKMLQEKGFDEKIISYALAYSSKKNRTIAHNAFLSYTICAIVGFFIGLWMVDILTLLVVEIVCIVLAVINYLRRNKIQVYKSDFAPER